MDTPAVIWLMRQRHFKRSPEDCKEYQLPGCLITRGNSLHKPAEKLVFAVALGTSFKVLSSPLVCLGKNHKTLECSDRRKDIFARGVAMLQFGGRAITAVA
jgi:hypothetical protein